MVNRRRLSQNAKEVYGMEDFRAMMISNEIIVDRAQEQVLLEKEILSPEADLTIIYAESGVGKSALTARVGRAIQNKKVITATTRPENEGSQITEGAFLTNIFNAIVRIMQNEKKTYPKCTLEYYLTHNKNVITKKRAIEKIFENVQENEFFKSLGWSLSKYVFARLFRLYEYDPVAILSLRDRDSMLIASDYIKYVLNKIPILLVVDNMQNVDGYSLQLMIDWILLSQSSSYYLLEFTVNSRGQTDALSKLVHKLQDYTLRVKLISLPYLRIEDALHAVELAQPALMSKDAFPSAAKEFYQTKSNGSMRKLLDFSLQYQEERLSFDDYDPTFERICALNSNSQYILGIVILHGGQIADSHLRDIVEYSIDPIVLDLEDTLETLLDSTLLEQTQDGYQITHAQIGDAWNQHACELRKFELLARRNCIIYYENILNSFVSSTERKEDALLFLIEAYAVFSVEKLGSLINQLDCIIFDRLQPERAWKYILLFLQKICGQEADYVDPIKRMVRFCFDHNLYKNCLFVLERLASVPGQLEQDFHNIYKINCMEYLECHTAAAVYCENCLKNSQNDKSRYYYLLLLMGCYRSLNRRDDYLACVDQIFQIPDYDSFLEYGYFLRLSEIYLSRQDALPKLSESVRFFQERGMLVQEIKSGITYAFLMAVAGDLRQAYQELNRYEEMAAQMHLFGNVFELNKASILLLQGFYGQEVAELLKKAELSTNGLFDRLLILTMQLINYIESRKPEVARTLLPRITALLERETDRHLIALVAYDLYRYYTQEGEHTQARKYHEIAQSAAAYNETVKYMLSGEINPQTPNLFHSSWNIGFTFFWSIDYEET